MLLRIQNDLFDLGADLCTPDTGKDLGWEPLRIVDAQVTRLEGEIDRMNAALKPLRSFVLPGGTALGTHLHLARTICRRAERLMVELSQTDGERVSRRALKYANRLSDICSSPAATPTAPSATCSGCRAPTADRPVFVPLHDQNRSGASIFRSSPGA